jgi:hypothetical protein
MISKRHPIVTWTPELDRNDGTLLIWQRLFTDPAFAVVTREQEKTGICINCSVLPERFKEWISKPIS